MKLESFPNKEICLYFFVSLRGKHYIPEEPSIILEQNKQGVQSQTKQTLKISEKCWEERDRYITFVKWEIRNFKG